MKRSIQLLTCLLPFLAGFAAAAQTASLQVQKPAMKIARTSKLSSRGQQSRMSLGGNSGGGGDASEVRFDEIRADLLKWMFSEGPHSLQLGRLGISDYRSQMAALLAPHTVIVGFVDQDEENSTRDLERKVDVFGVPKTCRGFISVKDHQPHILCSIERFAETSEADQYPLVHHEFAGLAGVEQNIGASSDYQISKQITEFLHPETVLKLGVNRQAPPAQNLEQQLVGFYQTKISGEIGVSMHPFIRFSADDVDGNPNLTAFYSRDRLINLPQRMLVLTEREGNGLRVHLRSVGNVVERMYFSGHFENGKLIGKATYPYSNPLIELNLFAQKLPAESH